MNREFDIEASHLMETLPGGIRELSALRSVMDDDDRCPTCRCHALAHAPHIERVDDEPQLVPLALRSIVHALGFTADEPVLISVACLECAVQKNTYISLCDITPRRIIDATPAGALQPLKTLEPNHPYSLAGITGMYAALTGRSYNPPTPPEDKQRQGEHLI
ncbi:MAG: hypothetical protein OXC95_15485 [Dehalococcoidia bacterium]|nr:hypothetical protein [Dehalococcoidia bacterium]